MALTDTAIRNAKLGEKPKKLYDERGLFLLVQPSGGKLWHLKYRYLGNEKKLSLGRYPDVSLKVARERRDEARALLANGADPASVKAALADERKEAASNDFCCGAKIADVDSENTDCFRHLFAPNFEWLVLRCGKNQQSPAIWIARYQDWKTLTAIGRIDHAQFGVPGSQSQIRRPLSRQVGHRR